MITRRPLFIFDLDGTLALCEHRQHLAQAGQWDAFFEACHDDKPNQPVIDTLYRLATSGCEVRIWTGRSIAVQAKTVDWLIAALGITDAFAITLLQRMRPINDHTPDERLKERWLSDMTAEERRRLVAVFDDRDKVVRMWRSFGVTCFQVAPGEF